MSARDSKYLAVVGSRTDPTQPHLRRLWIDPSTYMVAQAKEQWSQTTVTVSRRRCGQHQNAAEPQGSASTPTRASLNRLRQRYHSLSARLCPRRWHRARSLRHHGRQDLQMGALDRWARSCSSACCPPRMQPDSATRLQAQTGSLQSTAKKEADPRSSVPMERTSNSDR